MSALAALAAPLIAFAVGWWACLFVLGLERARVRRQRWRVTCQVKENGDVLLHIVKGSEIVRFRTVLHKRRDSPNPELAFEEALVSARADARERAIVMNANDRILLER